MGRGLDIEQWDDVPTPPMTEPKLREPKSPAKLLEMAADLRLRGANAMQISVRLALSYAEAVKLCEQLDGTVLRQLNTRYTPQVQAALKDDISDGYVEEFAVCRREGRKNPRAYTHMNTAGKHLAALHGLNAPTRSVSVEYKANALADPEVQDMIMSDPELRAAFMLIEKKMGEGGVPVFNLPPPAEGDGK